MGLEFVPIHSATEVSGARNAGGRDRAVGRRGHCPVGPYHLADVGHKTPVTQ